MLKQILVHTPVSVWLLLTASLPLYLRALSGRLVQSGGLHHAA